MNFYNPIAAVPVCSVSPESKPTMGAKYDYAEPGVNISNSVSWNPHQSESETITPKQSQNKPSSAKRTAAEAFKKKKSNKVPDDPKYDFTQVPPPYCSCTGIARRCYKYGPSGWQSTCCTTSMSEYPLPMNPLRPGSRRLSGRRMKGGAYTKILIKLASKGRDLSHPVDLKDQWGKARQ